MTNEEILRVYKGISDLNEKNIPLNIKTSYILAKNRQALIPFINIIENERAKLYQKYGEKQDDFTFTIPKENIKKLEEELNILMEIKNKIELTKLMLKDFGENEINIDILENLMPIIIEE